MLSAMANAEECRLDAKDDAMENLRNALEAARKKEAARKRLRAATDAATPQYSCVDVMKELEKAIKEGEAAGLDPKPLQEEIYDGELTAKFPVEPDLSAARQTLAKQVEL